VHLSEYAQLSSKTDIARNTERGLQIALHGLAGEAGSVVTAAKKWFRSGSSTGLSAAVSEELGDLLWYVAAVANRLEIDLDAVAQQNLRKTEQIFRRDLPPPSTYDVSFPDHQRFPRYLKIRFVEDRSGAFPIVKMDPLGDLALRFKSERVRTESKRKQAGLGDPLNDNSHFDDGYRFHDIFHLAHATFLGWSPVLRSLLGAKRKAKGDFDRTQDGARAIALEEGLTAFVFKSLENDGFLAKGGRLDWDLLRHIQRTVRGTEVEDQPPIAWQRAYQEACRVFLQLKSAGGGTVACDLDKQTLSYRKPR
jgi:NTP pyrophosphatase (non-canonical NTP hydrolase)